MYGQKEGAEVGYNPQKPGRPSQVIHVYEMNGTRLVLEAGKRNHSMYGLEGLARLLDILDRARRGRLEAAGRSSADFDSDESFFLAQLKRVEVVGEAANTIDPGGRVDSASQQDGKCAARASL